MPTAQGQSNGSQEQVGLLSAFPSDFLRKVQARICTQKLYPAQISEAGVLQKAGVSKCKRKWKLCGREKNKGTGD